ncbi:hypothetical protein Tco_0803234 [Tanacetum coccineum]|uniref:Transposase n=1 Tax=Tanacetum coccineum TaxID=301880 RepID=A0ABQ5A3H7_9ASTR
MRSHQNESLAIAGRNLFDDDASSSTTTVKILPLLPQRESQDGFTEYHSLKSQRGISSYTHFFPVGRTSALRDLILRFKQGDDEPIKSAWIRFQDLIKQFRFSSLTEEEGWNRIEEYVQYQDNLWDEPSPSMNVSFISEAMQPTLRRRLKRALCLSGGDIYNDHSLLRFYQNDDTSPWGNIKRKEKGEDGPEWIVRSKFEDGLANFMLKKKSHAKRIGDMLVQHRKELREQYSQILSAINKSETPKPEAPTFAITTRSGISTQDPPFPAPPRPATDNFTEGETEKEGLEGAEPSTTQEPAPPGHAIHYQPPRPSNPPLPSRLKKSKKKMRATEEAFRSGLLAAITPDLTVKTIFQSSGKLINILRSLGSSHGNAIRGNP